MTPRQTDADRIANEFRIIAAEVPRVGPETGGTPRDPGERGEMHERVNAGKQAS